MPGIRDIKRRIKSVQSTRKITRAMQLVSAAKMRKAQNATLASRTYSSLAWELIFNLSDVLKAHSPLLKAAPKTGKVGIILLSSNKGLVGSLNMNLSGKIKEINKDAEVVAEIISYGKKGTQLALNLNKKIIADYPKTDKTLAMEEVYPIANFVTECYKTGQYQQILIVYNHFVSTLMQTATIKQLLPFPGVILKQAQDENQKNAPAGPSSNYLFEPEAKTVLDHLLPRIIESQIYQAILESDASEHSARMIMMKNATDAAGDLIEDLTLTYNQIRQNKITTELAEITAGKIALE